MQQARESTAEIMRQKQAAGMYVSFVKLQLPFMKGPFSKLFLPCGQAIGSINTKCSKPTADAKKKAAKDAEVQAKKGSSNKK